MAAIHLFNPDNDLALANGSENFTPPRSAVGLATSGACLPMWYGNPGDVFVGAVNNQWYEDISSAFGLDVEPTITYRQGFKPIPWGWSAAARNRFVRIGTPAESLPDPYDIEHLRRLSHRATTVEVAHRAYRELPWLVGPGASMPRIVTNPEEALETINLMGRAMLKLPWSNAGRGQQESGRIPRNVLIDRIHGMLNRQGAIEIEPYYERLTDFALLFDENCRYVGLSLFKTDTHGGWIGNRLIDDNTISNIIGTDTQIIAEALQTILAEEVYAKGYSGPVGVDMMKAIDATGHTVFPIVEINLRRTMGHVAHILYSRFVDPGSSGSLTVVPRKTAPSERPSDCLIRERRLVSGKLDLVPPGGDFRILMSISPGR